MAPLSRLTWLFAAFILACGFTHFMEVVTFRTPVYWLSGAVKAVTAAVSWVTVVALIPMVPKLLGGMAAAGVVSQPAPRSVEDADADAGPRGYIVAILAAVMALLVRASLNPLLGDRQPYILPLLAVVVTAWYGGFGPAVACLVVAMVGTAMLFLPPYNSIVIDGLPNQLGFGMTLFVGLACAVLGQAQRSTRHALEAQLRATADKQRELEAEVVRRTAAEAASRDAKQFLESTINALSKHIAVLDENGTILEVNEAWLWATRDDACGPLRGGVGASYMDACAAAPAVGPAVADGIRAVLAGEMDRFTYEYPCHPADGERWFVVNVTRFVAGGFPRVVVSHEDISQRRHAENAVRDREERFRVLAELIPQLVWRASPAGEVEYFNLQWYRYTGQSAAAAVGGGWLAAVHPDDRDPAAAAWSQATATGENYAHEYRLRGADGTYRWFLVRGEPLRDPSGRILYWVGSCTDIDDQRRYAEHLERGVRERTAALESLNTELRRSNDDLDKFAYVASHDLQEPLRKIQAFGGRLEARCRDQLAGQGLEYLDRILASAGRMRRLIDDLLTFARVTSKARPFARTDLAAVAADVTADLEVRLAQAGGRVDIGPLPMIDADPSQMRQLFQNLIGNALKFQRPDVPPVVRISAAVDPAADGWECVITVADNGIGFEAEYRGRIFELFQRLHGRDHYEGTGLGLAICRKIVERHRGSITADGRPGEGATFTVRLPVHQPRGEA